MVLTVGLWLPLFQVTWVEHTECQRGPVHSIYRPIVNSGVAFGAWHWMATLQLQCERLVFSMATNVPTKDSSGTPLNRPDGFFHD